MVGSIHIQVSGTVFKRLGTMQRKMTSENLGGWMSAGPVTDFLQGRAIRRFTGEGDDVSGAWAELKKSTQGWRKWEAEKFGYNIQPKHPINVRSESLREWVTDNTSGGKPIPGGWHYQYPIALPKDPKLSAKLRGAQEGQPGRAPARPVLGVDIVDGEVIATMLSVWLRNFQEAT